MGFFSKKEAKNTQNPRRIEVEDCLDQEWTCAEIAEELEGVTVEEVYRIKQAKQRREAKLHRKVDREEGGGDNSVAALKKQLLEVELKSKIAQAEHEAHLRKLDMEDELGGPEELIESAQEGPDALLNTLLKNVLSKQTTLNSPPVQQHIPPTAGADSQQAGAEVVTPIAPTAPPALTLDFAKLEMGIKAGLLTEATFIKEGATMNLTPSKARDLYYFIKRKL